MRHPSPSATFQEATNPANWWMSIERKETKAGNVTYRHTVHYRGIVYAERTSKKEYTAYWIDVQKGVMEPRTREMIAYHEQLEKKYRIQAEQGGLTDQGHFIGAEKLTEWAEFSATTAQAGRDKLAEILAAGESRDYVLTDGGFCGRPDLAKGNLTVTAA